MLMEVMRVRLEAPHGKFKPKIYIDLWDHETQTNSEMRLSFPESDIEILYKHCRGLAEVGGKIDSVKLALLQTLCNKEGRNIIEAATILGGLS